MKKQTGKYLLLFIQRFIQKNIKINNDYLEPCTARGAKNRKKVASETELTPGIVFYFLPSI